MRRTISILVAGILAVAVGATVVDATRPRHRTVVRGVVAPEVEAYLNDPRVRQVLASHGMQLHLDVQADRRLPDAADPARDDFAFAANSSVGEAVAHAHQVAVTYAPFSSPMAIATFKPVARTLAAAGVARDNGGWWTLDVGRFAALVQRGQRWSDIAGATYRADAPVLIRSGDVAGSDAGALYAALAGFVANGNSVLETVHDVDGAVNAVSPLFVGQGSADQSSDAPFEDYVALGLGTTPMAMIYEAQFIERVAARDGSIAPDMVLMYPDPDVMSKRVVVPLDARGAALGRLLQQDPSLQRIAAEHGFRPDAAGVFSSFAQANALRVPVAPAGLVDLPPAAILDALVVRIDMARHSGLPAAPGARAIPASEPFPTHHNDGGVHDRSE